MYPFIWGWDIQHKAFPGYLGRVSLQFNCSKIREALKLQFQLGLEVIGSELQSFGVLKDETSILAYGSGPVQLVTRHVKRNPEALG